MKSYTWLYHPNQLGLCESTAKILLLCQTAGPLPLDLPATLWQYLVLNLRWKSHLQRGCTDKHVQTRQGSYSSSWKSLSGRGRWWNLCMNRYRWAFFTSTNAFISPTHNLLKGSESLCIQGTLSLCVLPGHRAEGSPHFTLSCWCVISLSWGHGVNEGEESSVKGAAETGNTQEDSTALLPAPGTWGHTPWPLPALLWSQRPRQGQGLSRRGPWSHPLCFVRALAIHFSVHFFFFFLPWQKQHHGGDCSFFPISEVRCLLHMGRRAYGPLCLFLSQDSFWLGKLHTACWGATQVPSWNF